MVGSRSSTQSGSRGRASQTQTVIAAIVIGAMLIVGVGVIGLIADSTPANQETTVTNESFTVTFTNNDDSPLYTVADENDPALEGDDEVDGDGFQDNEAVFNVSGDDVELTEGTDYNWFPDNGTVEIENTSTTQDPNGDPNGTYQITYEYETRGEKFHDTLDRIGEAVLIGGVVVIVLMATVILRVLRGL